MTLLARVAAALHTAKIPHALIGAGALAVYGVNRATYDHDLFAVEASCLRSDLWADLANPVSLPPPCTFSNSEASSP